ncbi:hypothetical protein ABPG74_004353 [Tetrahymena malaccensis]
MRKENLKKESQFERVSKTEIRKFLLRYFLSEWKMILLTQVVLFVQTYFNIYQPFFTQDFIEAAIQGKTDEMVELIKVFAYQNLFLIISEPLLEIFVSKFKKRLEIKIQSEIFQQILSKDIQFFEMTKFVQIQQLANQGSRSVMDLACGDRIFRQLKSIFRSIGHCYFLFYKSIYISLCLLAFCALKGFWNHYSNKLKLSLAKDNFKDMVERDNRFQDIMQNVMTVKAFGRESKEIQKYQKQLEKISDQSIKIQYQNSKMDAVSEILDRLQKIIVLYYGSMYFILEQKRVQVSTITTLLQYSNSFIQVYNAIKELIGLDDQNMYLLVEAIVKLFNQKPEQGLSEHIYVDITQPEKKDEDQNINQIHSTTNGEATSDSNQDRQISQADNLNKKRILSGDIQFDNVCYKYNIRNQDEYVLKNVNLQIKDGEFIAFAGTSGSGKSTIIKLIERFYDVNEGQILIGGKNIKDISIGLLRTQIGLVQQEPVLFDTTILENIVYGVDAYNMENVQEVCDISGVSEFVFDKERFPDGLHTLVGSKGLLLSGGQKQRVAIARALIKRPKILIFDEATSSLDAESEFQVQQYIDKLVKKRGMTIIVVAHRLSTIVNCDRIYVMQKGQIVEQGSHKELLDLNGYYKQLINRQLYNDENASNLGINNLSSQSLDNIKTKNDQNNSSDENTNSPKEIKKKSIHYKTYEETSINQNKKND